MHEELLSAVKEGNTHEVARLLEQIIDINNVKDGFGRTPLYWASAKGYKDITELLIKHKANIDAKGSSKQYIPLHIATEKGYLAIVNLLLENNANVDIKNNSKKTALHLAISNGHLKIVETLIKNKPAIIGAKDNTGNTALHLLYKLEKMDSFLEALALFTQQTGVNISVKNKWDKTLLQLFLEKASKSISLHQKEVVCIIQHLLKKGAKWNNSFFDDYLVKYNMNRENAERLDITALQAWIEAFYTKIKEHYKLPFHTSDSVVAYFLANKPKLITRVLDLLFAIQYRAADPRKVPLVALPREILNIISQVAFQSEEENSAYRTLTVEESFQYGNLLAAFFQKQQTVFNNRFAKQSLEDPIEPTVQNIKIN